MLNPTRSSRDKSRSCHASSAEFVSTLSAFSSCVRNASFSRPPSFTSNQTFQKHQARHNIQHQIFKPMDSTDRQRPKGEKLSSAQRRLRGRPRRTAPWPHTQHCALACNACITSPPCAAHAARKSSCGSDRRGNSVSPPAATSDR